MDKMIDPFQNQETFFDLMRSLFNSQQLYHTQLVINRQRLVDKQPRSNRFFTTAVEFLSSKLVISKENTNMTDKEKLRRRLVEGVNMEKGEGCHGPKSRYGGKRVKEVV